MVYSDQSASPPAPAPAEGTRERVLQLVLTRGPVSAAEIGRELREAREQRSRLQGIDAAAAALRHNLRGALSPALMMADRLSAHEDPAVQRAGTIVVRSIDRATALIDATRQGPAPAPTQER